MVSSQSLLNVFVTVMLLSKQVCGILLVSAQIGGGNIWHLFSTTEVQSLGMLYGMTNACFFMLH